MAAINTDPAAIVTAFAAGAFFIFFGVHVIRDPEEVGKHWMKMGMPLWQVKVAGWIAAIVGCLVIADEAIGLVGLSLGWIEPMALP